jgi:hypothetical protein
MTKHSALAMKARRLLLSLSVLSLLAGAVAQTTPPSTFMRTLGTSGNEYISSLQKTSDGGFIVAGYTNSSGAGGQDILLLKLDVSSAMQWAKTAGDDIAYSVGQTSDGGYIVGGSTDAGTGVSQLMLSKFDSNGAFQWTNALGDGFDSGAALSIQQTVDNGYIVTGFPHGGDC